jgi:hypothetical protein
MRVWPFQADAAAGLRPASSGATFEGRISEFLD